MNPRDEQPASPHGRGGTDEAVSQQYKRYEVVRFEGTEYVVLVEKKFGGEIYINIFILGLLF